MGGRISKIGAGPGDRVEAGDVLVVFDSNQLLGRIAEAEAAVASAEAELAALQSGPRDAEIQAEEAALLLAQAQQNGALSAWENAQEQAQNPQEIDARIAEARTGVSLAEQGVEMAEAELARQQLLRGQTESGTLEREVADITVRACEEALAAATAELQAAQTALDRLWAIRSEPLALLAEAHAAEGDYQRAEAGVAVAQARLDDLLAGPQAEEIAVAQDRVDLARAQVAILRSQLSLLSLVSPQAGVVLDQMYHPGEVAPPATTILTLSDLSRVTLIAYVPAGDVDQVQLGQEVEVTVEGYPERIFTGQVEYISDQPEFTPSNVATVEERQNTSSPWKYAFPTLTGT